MKKTREFKLIKNTFLYFLGNFASKILNIILMPIYIIFIEAKNFGEIDLILLLSAVLSLFFTLDMTDAVYRYMMDADTEEKRCQVTTSSIVVYSLGIGFFLLLYLFVDKYFQFKYVTLFALHVIFVNFSQYLMQVSRGLQFNFSYAVAGSIQTITQGIANIVFIVFLHYGAESILISQIIASIITILFLSRTTKFNTYIDLKAINWNLVRSMTKYSFPMFVQILILWIIQNSGTYFLRYFTQNSNSSGIYAMANKIPSMINSLASIFLLAWQESAIISKNDKDANTFYKNIYSRYFYILIFSFILMLPLIRIYFSYVVSESYLSVWKYVPIFFGVSIMSSLSIFVSTHFIAEKKSDRIVKTLIIPLIVVIFCDFMVVKRYGIFAVGISQLAAYTIALFSRKMLVPNTYSLNIDIKTVFLIVMLILTLTLYYLISTMQAQALLFFMCCMAFFILEYKEIKLIIFRCKEQLLNKG